MDLTARRLNRATLARQLLLRREPLSVEAAVKRLGPVQAQEPASPYLALWSRLAGFAAAELDAAFAARTIVKASLIRVTLHAVHASDYPAFHHAMLPGLRASRLADRRFAESGLSIAQVDDQLAPLSRFMNRPRTGAEAEAFLDERLARRGKPAWWALRTFAPLHRVPTGGAWSFEARPAYVAARTEPTPEPADASAAPLLLRYLRAFGPASARDFAQFTLLRRPVVKDAVETLGDALVEYRGPGGMQLYDVRDGTLPAPESCAPPRLLPMWDNSLLAYADRSRVVPDEYRPLVIRRNGDVLPTLLVDGYVAGVWRTVEGGVEATAFRELDEAAWEGLTEEARALIEFLGPRDPAVYRRYANWWKELPGHEVRRLP